MSSLAIIALAFLGCAVVVLAAAALVSMFSDGTSGEEEEDPIEAEYRVESIRGRLE